MMRRIAARLIGALLALAALGAFLAPAASLASAQLALGQVSAASNPLGSGSDIAAAHGAKHGRGLRHAGPLAVLPKLIISAPVADLDLRWPLASDAPRPGAEPAVPKTPPRG